MVLLENFRAGLLVTDSLTSFPSSKNSFISSWFLKDIFTGYWILGWQSFSFSTLEMSFHFFLASRVFYVKSIVIQIDHLYVMHCLWSSLSFFQCIHILLSLGSFLPKFFQLFLVSPGFFHPSGTLQMLDPLLLSYRSLKLSSLFQWFLCLLFRLDTLLIYLFLHFVLRYH